ncbi:zinc ribbon domain-containing protein [Alloalcanivorax mobilis]|uniref:zinc ribbon domain-containing protein n=1 Tax=Alloalcanivorax mobilis TaxID=2019569 RepID=UPI000B5B44D1|nr:zinc ribbon domain-containing protein [Alloalcanivorax mobilis]ASK33077.1 formamidase [Alcanivorax sp. N3-2A]ASK36895.1 formamidase [Alcanivorax sp. N3-2A]|tara:strand:+ start:6328 stop:6660 length:333 start_codon:yes stop_codon:yes gene_type:complete
MPLYDYKCADHGLFHELVPVSASGECCPCPHCGVLSARVILVAPALLDMAPEKRQAMARNEHAAHEPRHGNHATEKDRGCCHHARDKPKVFYTAEGHKMFPTARPWMISH